MAYNPLKEITHYKELKDFPILNIDRKPDDQGPGWLDNYRLIENVLSRDEEVANCAMDPDGQMVYVALNGDMYNIEDLEEVDSRLRQLIGKVACFDFGTDVA